MFVKPVSSSELQILRDNDILEYSRHQVRIVNKRLQEQAYQFIFTPPKEPEMTQKAKDRTLNLQKKINEVEEELGNQIASRSLLGRRKYEDRGYNDMALSRPIDDLAYEAWSMLSVFNDHKA